MKRSILNVVVLIAVGVSDSGLNGISLSNPFKKKDNPSEYLGLIKKLETTRYTTVDSVKKDAESAENAARKLYASNQADRNSALETITKLKANAYEVVSRDLKKAKGMDAAYKYINPNLSSSSSAYDVLGIKKGATSAEIKKAYYAASLKVHPDKAQPDKKAVAQEAFTILSNSYNELK